MSKSLSKWLKALRSGKYKQGRKFLRKGKEYCCLGVACELYAKEHPEFKITQIGELYGYGERKKFHSLPTEVRDWLGLRNHGGMFASPEENSLATLNDMGIPFPQIADIIEGRPEGLFNDSNAEESEGN